MQFLQKLVYPCIVGSKIPIICNQENFLLRSNSYKIFQAVPGFHFFIKPAVKDVLDRGRPKNGMFIGIRTVFVNMSKMSHQHTGESKL